MHLLRLQIPAILHSSLVLACWFVAYFLVFTLLWTFMPCNPGQPWWRKDSLTDIAYFFLLPIGSRIVRIYLITGGVYLFLRPLSKETLIHFLKYGYGPVSTLPLWLQAALVFLLQDFLLYWMHRLFHGKILWRFHAVHHSPTEVDWLSAARFHPVNAWLTFTLVDVLMLFIGFPSNAVTVLAVFNMSYSAMVHANLNWTFGKLGYVFASPVFHRWHHTAQEEGLDKNFAPSLAFLDVVFGTFYMPEARKPERYGVPGMTMPKSFLGQIVWPFRRQP